MSASAISKPIFKIKSTEDKNNIYTPMLSGSGKNFLSFGYLYTSALPKISGVEFASYSITILSGIFKFEL